MKKILIYLLCLSMVLIPGSSQLKTQEDYTMLIPEEPVSLILYYHSNSVLPHARNRTSRTLYNFQEDYIEVLSRQNPNSIIIITYYYNDKLVKNIEELIEEYKIPEVIVSGWSAGGNNAARAAATLAQLDTRVQLLLIDCNHTNEVSSKHLEILKDKNVQITYTSNTISKAKNKKLSNIMSYEIPINYLQLYIPNDFEGSRHMYCRDSAMTFNLYGYLLGTSKLSTNYTQLYYDYQSKDIKSDN